VLRVPGAPPNLRPLMRRFALYAFVITLVWLSFIIAISFIEAPLKFSALGIKQPITEVTTELQHALKIGHAVMHKLNRIEWVCCAFTWFLLLRIRIVRTRGSVILLGAITALLAFQTWGLYPPLDERTRLIISGTLPATTWHHVGFGITEGVKALLLGVLTGAQIQSYAQAVVSE
jgi:hypothetical protein